MERAARHSPNSYEFLPLAVMGGILFLMFLALAAVFWKAWIQEKEQIYTYFSWQNLFRFRMFAYLAMLCKKKPVPVIAEDQDYFGIQVQPSKPSVSYSVLMAQENFQLENDATSG